MKSTQKSSMKSNHKATNNGDQIEEDEHGVAVWARDFTPNPEAPLPPLPEPVSIPTPGIPVPPFPSPTPIPIPHFRALREGCYLLNYVPTGSKFVIYDGMMRVDREGTNTTASGDLYQRRLILLPPKPGSPPISFPPIPGPGPNPGSGIPIFARSQYRYYLSVTQILESITFGKSFTLGFKMYRFNIATTAWTDEGLFTAPMTWVPAPAGYPSSGDYLTGDVKNSAGTIVGKLTMGWVSKWLRKATVEIDRVSVSEAPLTNSAGEDWKSAYDDVGWDITVVNSNNNVAEPSGPSWSNGEMHAAMLARRDSSNLDTEWRYHVLAVRNIDVTPRGIMYDTSGTDSNKVPREGIGIASHWMIPNTAEWGLVKGMRFGAAAKPYFRTAIHEIGHAMGLYHNPVDNGFMNTTDVIAANATPGTPFPENIKWSFAPDNQKQLRHYPDVFVRPGGTEFGTASTTTPPISPDEMVTEIDGLALRAWPMMESMPLGAPVRVNIALVNTSNEPMLAPASLSMKSGFVRGKVVDPSGTVRAFSPILRCLEEDPVQPLHPGESVRDSMTLLRGPQGSLFPAPGPHRIIVEAHWDVNGVEYCVTASISVMVTGVRDDAHARAALRVLSTPDILPALVFGGDHLTDGIEAIHAALKNPVLRPHYAYIEAKRVAERFGKRKPNLKAAAELIDDAAVMTPAEVKKAAKLIKDEPGDGAIAKSIAKTLKSKAKSLDASQEINDLVEAL